MEIEPKFGLRVQVTPELAPLAALFVARRPGGPAGKEMAWSVVASGVAYIATALVRGTFTLEINAVIFILLLLGLALHRRPIAYVRAVKDAALNSGARLSAPQPLAIHDQIDPELVAEACGISASDIETRNHAPSIASCGAPFLFVEVNSRKALATAQHNASVFASRLPRDHVTGVHLYTPASDDGVDIQSRMFAPLHGIPEDPATGSANVALIGRTKEKLDSAAAEIRKTGVKASGHPADVRDYDALAAAIKSARDELGEIDLVVCGAAGNFPSPALGMSANGFKAVIDIDLLGTFNTCRAVFEHLRRPGASIINISAMQAFTPMALQAHVCAAKAGVDMLTKCLAIEWGGQGVRVNSIAPGAVDDTVGVTRQRLLEQNANTDAIFFPAHFTGATAGRVERDPTGKLKFRFL